MTRLATTARSFIKQTLRKQGFELKRKRDGFHYAPDYYGRSFAMRTDIRSVPVFSELAAATLADGRSCLYYDRLYVLYQTLENLKRLAREPVRMVEIGVYKGGTSAYLARAAAALGFTDAQIHSFDTFEGHASVDINRAVDPFHEAGDFHDTSFEAVGAYLAQFPNVTLYKGRFADRCDALGTGPLALVHLDVDLYGPTLHALEFADSRLISGGTVIVDDYEVTNCMGVKTAVQEFLATHPRYFAIHPMTEQCLLIKQGNG